MSRAFDELLTQLPLWLGKFTQSLTHPSQVLSEQLAMASAPQAEGKPEAKPVHDGVRFLILFFAVAAGVSIAFSGAQHDAAGSGPGGRRFYQCRHG